ncbi:PE-PGRS family protein [Streptomyces sp. XD-27]|uniref:PE-PGRS family protein n=1 Tax=Streptomyces sp. XD-27 TaxID=3062779 RepID=UPI0026F467A5|nr:PE-PGRS family protein [Streptomyces sp. XD-27]WKX73511.1 PE-PGRS family protein [Streptomyces sp. XD-27]
MEARHVGHVLRALRAAVFAAVCVLLAALGHAVMSGAAVPWWAIASALAVTGGAAWCLAGRERGPLLVTGATVGAQLALHTVFTLAQEAAAGRSVPSAGAGAGAGAAGVGAGAGAGAEGLRGGGLGASRCGAFLPLDPGGHAGHLHQAGQVGSGGMPEHGMSHGASMPGTDMSGMGMSAMDMAGMHHGHGALGMWSAHVLVALICGIWLSGGEQAAFRLGRTLAVRLFAPLLRLLRDPAPVAGPPRVRPAHHGAGQRLRRLLLVHVIATRGPPPCGAVV